MSEELRRNQHLVSKGYQRNFASGHWLTVLNANTGEIVDPKRSIRTNWRVTDFLSVVSPDGELDDSLEREFAQNERVFLNVIREIELDRRVAPEQKAALDALAATHTVRSLSFASTHDAIVRKVIDQLAPSLAGDERAAMLFEKERGRPPGPGDLEEIVASVAVDFAEMPDLLASSIRRLAARLQQLLEKWTIQLVGSACDLPGFVLPDRPVVHGRRSEGRFGFHDAGAIGDADLIVVPINRHLVAFYSGDRLRDLRLRTKNGVRWVNSLLLRGADREVACHPDDAQEISRLIRDSDRYPPERFDSVTIR